MKLQQLYRPVGLYELRLIQAADYMSFPPRLPHQPFFYPVLTLDYAVQIARDWNTEDEASGFMGAVTAFEVDAVYVSKFEEHVVGSTLHRELWIPSDELRVFNQHIHSAIRILNVFYGERFSGERAW